MELMLACNWHVTRNDCVPACLPLPPAVTSSPQGCRVPTLRDDWASSSVSAITIKRRMENTHLLTPHLPYVKARHQMKYVRWELRALEKVIPCGGSPPPPTPSDAWLRRVDLSQGPWPSPGPPGHPRLTGCSRGFRR